MKNILKLTLIVAGVLMITSCQEDPIVDRVDQSVVTRASFLTNDYFVLNNVNSLGAIYLSNTQSWKVGDKIRVTGSIKFKRPDSPGYATNEYVGNCEIIYVTANAIFVGYDYAGINYAGNNTTSMHIEFNKGVIELIQPLPGNDG